MDPPMLSAIWLTTSAMFPIFPERSVDSRFPKLGESGSAGGADTSSGSTGQHARGPLILVTTRHRHGTDR